MSAKLSELSEGEGNAKSPPPKRFQKKYWKCNYHLKDKSEFDKYFELIERLFAPLCETYAFGEEYGESGDTPHIEGYMIFHKITEFHIIQDIFEWSFLKWSTKARAIAGLKYSCKELNRIVTNMKNIPRPLVKMTYDMLRPEQREIADVFKGYEDPLFGRKIYWFWESVGNWGKSITVTYMIDQMDAIEVCGKGADVFCGISNHIEDTGQCPPIVIYDVPRSSAKYVSYASIEKIKDGKFFSGKYDSKPVRFNKPHIVCFANCPPEFEDTVSKDRWIIKKLVKCDCSLGRREDQLCPICNI